jgi:hypothetical protein
MGTRLTLVSAHIKSRPRTARSPCVGPIGFSPWSTLFPDPRPHFAFHPPIHVCIAIPFQLSHSTSRATISLSTNDIPAAPAAISPQILRVLAHLPTLSTIRACILHSARGRLPARAARQGLGRPSSRAGGGQFPFARLCVFSLTDDIGAPFSMRLDIEACPSAQALVAGMSGGIGRARVFLTGGRYGRPPGPVAGLARRRLPLLRARLPVVAGICGSRTASARPLWLCRRFCDRPPSRPLGA